MAIENVQQLLTEQLGKMRCDIISTTAMTSRDYYCIHFPVDSVIASISAANAIAGGGSAYSKSTYYNVCWNNFVFKCDRYRTDFRSGSLLL
jgi:hypothetical protein